MSKSQVLMGLKGTTRGNLFASSEMSRETFKPKEKTTTVTRRVTRQREGSELVSSWEAPLPLQTNHPSEVVPKPWLVCVACAACDANAEIDGGREREQRGDGRV